MVDAPHDAVAVAELRQAAEVIERFVPAGRDRRALLRRLHLCIRALDPVRRCRACKETFTFTNGELFFYRERGYDPPTHCARCRAERRAARADKAIQEHHP